MNFGCEIYITRLMLEEKSVRERCRFGGFEVGFGLDGEGRSLLGKMNGYVDLCRRRNERKAVRIMRIWV